MCMTILIQFRKWTKQIQSRLSQHPSVGPSPWHEASSVCGCRTPPVSQSVSWLRIIRYLVPFSCVHTQTNNTHHALLHITKYFFKSLYYNSGTLTARSCRIFSKCNKVADKNLIQLKTSNKCMSVRVFSLFPKQNKLITCMWLNMSHYTQ